MVLPSTTHASAAFQPWVTGCRVEPANRWSARHAAAAWACSSADRAGGLGVRFPACEPVGEDDQPDAYNGYQ